ncbi:MAG: sigma-70 family RNA polymerase sigma factor, partial [Phycisphaerae bacterium]|nr:sigma-70 family RNA polymerase sigma factor [Phycisphaerae bacterium]
RDWVYKLAWRFGRREDVASDVVQEVFSYLLWKFPGFVLTARMTTFLYPVVKHLTIAMIKKNQKIVLDDELLDDAVAPPAVEGDDQRRAELAVVLGRLTARQREIILMRYVDGMTLEEIAEALEMPMGTVKSSLHRGLKALKEDSGCRRYFLG